MEEMKLLYTKADHMLTTDKVISTILAEIKEKKLLHQTTKTIHKKCNTNNKQKKI